MLLADPNFNCSGKIDLLLGGDVDAIIQMAGFKRLGNENIIARESRLGWLVSGSTESVQCLTSSLQIQEPIVQLDKTLRSFWEIENVPLDRIMSKNESLCEMIYEKTTVRATDGKYVVSLPFRHEIKGFSEMRQTAVTRFIQLEKRLQRNFDLRMEYTKCLKEYGTLEHMIEVDPCLFKNAYYIPHHCVIKQSSSTTKLRVVFDASAVDKDLNSLNAHLLNGPRLQVDLLDHLMKFRLHKFAFTADIEKMYRQIWINPEDHKFQLILWRSSSTEELKTYALKTVTFGTAPAPYLAIKTLERLANDECAKWPLGAFCLKNSFYVDDFLYGSDTLDSALKIQKETIEILRSAGFKLRKWSASNPTLLEGISESDRECNHLLEFNCQSSVKTLGIFWNTITDSFSFHMSVDSYEITTKRNILSNIAKIFDPLGWLSPFVILAKIFIQKLWKIGAEWDQPLTYQFEGEWKQIAEGISLCNQISIPRWVGTVQNSDVELHGFADASSAAFAAVIYIKSILNSKINVNLLISKTKVAPLKELTIPRLELSAALLLAQLMGHVHKILQISPSRCFYWSDSTIVLAWIKDDPGKRSIFVANRILEIQSLSDTSHWNHVISEKNPADMASRGVYPQVLINESMWWPGPDFLQSVSTKTYLHDLQSDVNVVTPPEEDKRIRKSSKISLFQTLLSQRKTSVIELSSNITKFSNESLNKYSTLNKLCRVVAYCKRFLNRHRPEHIHISPEEFECSLITILRIVQEESYTEELCSLQNSEAVSKKSTLFNLNPFICQDGLLRSDSCLRNADHLSYDQRFPIFLPRKHIFSHLIVRQAHLSTAHGTQQMTAAIVCQRYHISRVTSLVRFITNKCVICFRTRCQGSNQQMGALPNHRVTPNRPFTNTGVDFAGPFELKTWKGKCNSFYKAYIALFICFSTKAVHMEIVIDLSSAAFIAAFRRFIARRGMTQNMYSDCGTNFVGAGRTVTRSITECNQKWSDEVQKELSVYHTNWHFNPPGSPHFSGLWEAGVKSAKYHLKRIIGSSRFTYDELETYVLQVESCMNSRPLCYITGNPDAQIITPAHFLIHDSLLALPETIWKTKKFLQPTDGIIFKNYSNNFGIFGIENI